MSKELLSTNLREEYEPIFYSSSTGIRQNSNIIQVDSDEDRYRFFQQNNKDYPIYANENTQKNVFTCPRELPDLSESSIHNDQRYYSIKDDLLILNKSILKKNIQTPLQDIIMSLSNNFRRSKKSIEKRREKLKKLTHLQIKVITRYSQEFYHLMEERKIVFNQDDGIQIYKIFDRDSIPDYEREFLQKVVKQFTMYQQTQKELTNQLYCQNNQHKKDDDKTVVFINQEEEQMLQNFLEDYEKTLSQKNSSFCIELKKERKNANPQFLQMIFNDEFDSQKMDFSSKSNSQKKQRSLQNKNLREPITI